MHIDFTGSKGQLGRFLQEALKDENVFPLNHTNYDIAEAWVIQIIVDIHPDIVIHTSTMTKIDYCTRTLDSTYFINNFVTKNINASKEMVCR